jgi:hypothetical protein
MKVNLRKHQGGGVVFVDITTKKPITSQWRKSLSSAEKYWVKHYKQEGKVMMKPVADVQFFFMQYEAEFE